MFAREASQVRERQPAPLLNPKEGDVRLGDAQWAERAGLMRRALEAFHLSDGGMERFSRLDDMTLANPTGPPRLGRADVEQGIELAAANFEDVYMRGEEISRYATADLGYVVWIERGEVRLVGSEDIVRSSLRVT